MKRKKPPPERCALCSLDPALPEHRGRQIYVCDQCGTLVCSDCSEDGDPKCFTIINPVVCKPCYHEQEELKAEQAGLR